MQFNLLDWNRSKRNRQLAKCGLVKFGQLHICSNLTCLIFLIYNFVFFCFWFLKQLHNYKFVTVEEQLYSW